MASQPDATGLLAELSGGRGRAADELLPLVYEELRGLAAVYLRREGAGHTLQPTALVHEAYVKLVDETRAGWNGRTHFKAVAAKAMYRVLVDHARARGRRKRGRGWQRVALDDAFALTDTNPLEVLALHEALEAMRRLDARQAEVVELLILGGLSSEEAAQVLGVSQRTVERDWKMGRAWLRRELGQEAPAS